MLFCDKGSWFGYSWAEDALLEWTVLTDDSTGRIHCSSPVLGRYTYDDRLEALVAEGRVVLRFVDARTAEFRAPPGVVLASDQGALEFVATGPGRYRHVMVNGPYVSAAGLASLPRTLRWNWRQPLGDIHHGGIIPSPHGYRGFWAWDSWKHAAVLPEDLAREQIAAMFDHQRPDGMVPDTVMVDARRNNWRCSKPPLAAWACAQHPRLLEEFRPHLLRYHAWWEAHRHPPGERLFAYGGRDLVASKWESGWDNATRFDAVVLVGEVQNVLAVDLNAYLCMEKRLLGMPDPGLEQLVDTEFFHDGAFYDVSWPDHRPIRTLTAATWIPLWCGIASPDHAAAVIRLMLDPAHFNTPLPFPTVARSDPKFDPDGYWRGSVWMDHAAWAVEVLVRYGQVEAARDAARRLLAVEPDWECYNPLTGAPAKGARPAVPQFSWTAAARLSIERTLTRLG